MSLEGRRIDVAGTVQGVGYRPWVYRVASELGIAGRVHNHSGGVTIEAFGEPRELDRFVRELARSGPPAARVERVTWHAVTPESPAAFSIVASESQTQRRIAVPPDLATCAACLREIQDPSDRRYRYPFTNCTDCGPRFTIVRDVPYDRAATTMAAFVMCGACRREYDDPENRRFHAEPNACPACGPRLMLFAGNGVRLATRDPLVTAACALANGELIAVKGIGGYHLACDATARAAVARLRSRKHREAKPLAVMVADLAAARRHALLSDREAELLASPARPIVLLERKRESSIVPEVAGDDNPLIGLMLAYSPLHHLLLAEVERPLVMTSGNLSDEPLCFRDLDAFARLGAIADLFLTHDREIEAPCDDSVTRVLMRRPVVMRRARGYVPGPTRVTPGFARSILACGGDLKNAFCLAAGDVAHLGSHVGDLESVETHHHFEAGIERLIRLVGVEPEIVAHDLHPNYFSTRYAKRRAGAAHIGVQHHHAHVASAMAEHGVSEPVIGVAFDGTGWGTDGAAWGGEILLATRASFERVATLRPLRLAGGDAAIRHPWRLALAALLDAFAGDPPLDRLPSFGALPVGRLRVVRQLLEQGVQSPLAHGCGRWFDALGALALGRTESRFEADVATSWEYAADRAERARYPFEIDLAFSPWQLDLRPMVRQAVADLLAGRGAPLVSARFHNTLVAATAELVRMIVRRRGRHPVALTGGCFQNPRLAEGLVRELAPELTVLIHHAVPPGDGGLALGQAVIADAVMRSY